MNKKETKKNTALLFLNQDSYSNTPFCQSDGQAAYWLPDSMTFRQNLHWFGPSATLFITTEQSSKEHDEGRVPHAVLR